MTGYIPHEKDLAYFKEISRSGTQRAKELLSDAYSSLYVRLPPYVWDHIADQFEAAMIEEFQVSGRVEIEAEAPADVTEAAKDAIFGYVLPSVMQLATSSVASAILAERERCANIVQNEGLTTVDLTTLGACLRDGRMVDSIRRGDE